MFTFFQTKNKFGTLIKKSFSAFCVLFLLVTLSGGALTTKTASAQSGTGLDLLGTPFVPPNTPPSTGGSSGFVTGGGNNFIQTPAPLSADNQNLITKSAAQRAAQEKAAAEQKANDDSDWLGIKKWFDNMLLELSRLILQIGSWILGAAGTVFNAALKLSVVEFKRYADNPGVNLAWKTFRDIANMFFIFILLYIAIMTILDMGNISLKKMLSRIIIIALLLNFSLFFTKVIIDGSNILAIGFYNQLVHSPCVPGGPLSKGVSEAFMCKMGITNLYSNETFANTTKTPWQLLSFSIFSFFFMLIAAFVFLAAAVMFIGRSLIFILLLILSPLAFISMALPNDKYSGRWWDKLFEQCIFAPAFLAFLWATFQILGSLGLKPDLSKTLNTGVTLAPGETISGTVGDTLLNFGIVLGLLIASLTVAIETGGVGAEGAKKMLDKSKGWAQAKIGSATFGTAGAISRRTVGATGRAITDVKWMKNVQSKGGVGGAIVGAMRAGAKKTAEASFDARNVVEGFGKATGKGGYNKLVDDRKKEIVKIAKSLAPSDKEVDQAKQKLKNVSERGEAVKKHARAKEEEAKKALPPEAAKLEKMWESQKADIQKAADKNTTPQEKQRLQMVIKNRSVAIADTDKKLQANPAMVAFKRIKRDREIVEKEADEETKKAQAVVDEHSGVDKKKATERAEATFESSGRKRVAENEAKKNGLKEDSKEFKNFVKEAQEKYAKSLEKEGIAKIRALDFAMEAVQKPWLKAFKLYLNKENYDNNRPVSMFMGTRYDEAAAIRKEFSKGPEEKQLDKLLSGLKEKKDDDGGGKPDGGGDKK